MRKASVHRKREYVFIAMLVFALLPGKHLWAQLGAASLKGPGIGISMDYLPASHYIRPEDSMRTQSTTAQERYNFAAAFMLHNREDTVTGKVRNWSIAASGSYTRFANKEYDQEVFPEKLLGMQVLLQHYRSIGNRWSMVGIISLGLYTDLEQIDKEDVFVNGGVLFVKQHSPRFSYGIGAMFTNSFGTPMLLPAFLVRWQTGGRYRLDLDFPEKISVSRTLSKRTDIALAIRTRGAVYDVLKRPGNQRLMGYMEISAGLESTWHLSRQVDFVASGGCILTSGVTFQEKKLSEMFSDKDMHRFATNYFLSGGLRWNFKK
jgi:hypothetical protein